ncbi:hypothetical protein V8C26DRAFT_413296 [Trichoderma gracile]
MDEEGTAKAAPSYIYSAPGLSERPLSTKLSCSFFSAVFLSLCSLCSCLQLLYGDIFPMEVFDIENVWPDVLDGPPPPSPPPSPPSPDPPPIAAREPTPWEDLQVLEDERLFASSAVLRELLYGEMYAHLPNEHLDWDLEGVGICRVTGGKCYGKIFSSRHTLKPHLLGLYHTARHANLPPRELTPPPRARNNATVTARMSPGGTSNTENQAWDITGGEVLEIPDSEDESFEVTVGWLLEKQGGQEQHHVLAGHMKIPISQTTDLSQAEADAVQRDSGGNTEGTERAKSEGVILVEPCNVVDCPKCAL